jgi:NADH:ubiquinone oxidoreductase subunit 6 (subunit J)
MVLATLICCSRNPMYTIFSFITLIVFLFIFLIKYDVEFIAIAFLIIYIGAIMVLFLFVIFLLNLYNVDNHKLVTSGVVAGNVTFWWGLLLGLLVVVKGFMVFWFLRLDLITAYAIVLSPLINSNTIINDFNKYEQMLLLATSKVDLLHFYDINTVGYLLYSNFKIYLVCCGIILLVTLVGSILLVTSKK